MELINYMQWDKLHLDGVIVLLVICAGFWQKKYLASIKLLDAWKTLLVSFVFSLVYVLLLVASKKFKVEKLVDYFISFGVSTSLYDLLLKPLIKKFFPNENNLV